jgi:hypothetical protein
MPTIDLAYQIRAGQLMLDTGHLLRADPFTFTVLGRPWLNQQWGAQVAFAALFRAGGWELIAVVRAAIVGLTFWLTYLACRARGAGARQAAWLCLGALLVSIYGFMPRPQLLGFLLFALALAIVANRDRHPRLLWLVPAITLVWANLHGSFVLAPLLLLFAWAEDRGRRLPSARRTLLVMLAAIAAATLNPFGVRVWSYVADLSTNAQVRRTIDEWQPPSVTTAGGLVFYVSLLAVAVLAVRERRRLGWPRLAELALFALIGVSAIRGVIWWSLAAPVLLADLFPERSQRRERPRVLNTAIAAGVVVVGVVFLPWFRPTFASSANSATVADGLLAFAPEAFSSRVLGTVPPGSRVFVAEPWASWFELVAPRYPVMVDPRIELFPDDVWSDYDTISAADDGWEAIVDRRGIDVLVLTRKEQSSLIAALEGDPGWRVLYEDEDGALLVRASGTG